MVALRERRRASLGGGRCTVQAHAVVHGLDADRHEQLQRSGLDARTVIGCAPPVRARDRVGDVHQTSPLLDYSATKGAIHALTQSLAENLVSRGIRVNCVAPGPVWTPLNPAADGASPQKVAKFGSNTQLGRPAQPEEIAPAYVFFASDADSSFITGQILPILGGSHPG